MAYKIVLDAGHGGTDPGAIYKERKEKDDNLALTLAKSLKTTVWMWYILEPKMSIRLHLRRRALQISRALIILFRFTGTAARKIINIRVWKSLYMIKAE